MAAFFLWLGSLAVKWGGSAIVDKLIGLAGKRLDAATDRDKLDAQVAVDALKAEAEVAKAVEERRRIEAGHWTGRLLLLLFLVPPAGYLAGIYWVSLFPWLGWSIARLPPWMETMMTALVPAWLGVHGVTQAVRGLRR